MTKIVTIGGLSRLTGVNIETIRYYEREKILPRASRDPGGRRIYREADVKLLNFIHKCRELGFPLKEIMGLLSLVNTGTYTCAQVHDMTVHHAAKVREKIDNLEKMESVLLEMAQQCSQGNVAECPIIDTLYIQ